MNLKITITRANNGSLKILLHTIFLFVATSALAQSDTIKYDISLSGLTSSGIYSPFWLQSNQYGKILSSPSSANLSFGFAKDYKSPSRIFDYSFNANLLFQTDKTITTIYFHELYTKARLFFFDAVIGCREEHFGVQDSTLSGGGILFSGNARPMPKISIGIERFTTVPYTFGFIEIKGGLAHGWFTDNIYSTGSLLHHKYLYGKLGGKLPLHIEYGFDHVTQWGGLVPFYGQQPTALKDFLIVFMGRSGGSNATTGEQINSLGNHILSQSLKVSLDISDYKIAAYWQNISEDGPIRIIGHTMNKLDGLWGISLRNKNFPIVKGILYEFLNTTDQSGPYHDKDGLIYGGNDNYFINYVYNNGWSYYSRIIGTPFITSAIYNKNGEVYTINNRVKVHHLGIEGDIVGYRYKALASFSKNYGTYSLMQDISNTSTLLEINKCVNKKNGLEIGCSISSDFGKLFGNSMGVLVSVRKTGTLFKF